KGDSSAELREWSRKLLDELKTHPEMTDIDSDQQENGVETNVRVDPTAAARLGIRANAVDASLYDAFGQRQVATIYTELNQYHVVMEWAPEYTQSPNALADVYVPGTSLVNQGGKIVAIESAAATSAASGTGSTGAGGVPSSAAAANVAVPVSPNPALRNASTGNVLSNT